MKFLTYTEANEWIDGRALRRPESGSASGELKIPFPDEDHQYYKTAAALCSFLGVADEYLLLLQETGIWPSSENLHLYYRLRESYRDYCFYDDAPGHLFLKHEQADLISFLQLSMLNGWGGYVISSGENNGFFFSHDEYFIFCSDHDERIKEVARYFD